MVKESRINSESVIDYVMTDNEARIKIERMEVENRMVFDHCLLVVNMITTEVEE